MSILTEPSRRVAPRWVGCFALAWLAQLTPIQLLPTQVDHQLRRPDGPPR